MKRTLFATPSHRLAAWLCLLLTAAGVTAARAAEPALPATSVLRADDRIVFVGDSITGQGWNNADGFIHLIDTVLKQQWPTGKVTTVPLGGSGQSVASWQGAEKGSREKDAFLDVKGVNVKEALGQPADVLIVMLGMNDLLSPYVSAREADLVAWADHYRELVAALRERVKPRVVALATISLCSENPESPKNTVRMLLNARIAKLAQAEGYLVLPVGEEMLAMLQEGRKLRPDFHVTTDFVHPKSAGHLAIALGMLKGLGEAASAQQVADKYLPAIRKEAAGTGPILSWKLTPLNAAAVTETPRFRVRYWYRASLDDAGKEAPKVTLTVPAGWTVTPANATAATGDFTVVGPADLLVTNLTLAAAVGTEVKQVTVPVPAPWLMGTGVANNTAWPSNQFDPVRGHLAQDDAIVAGTAAGVAAADGKGPVWQRYVASVDFTGGAEPGSLDFTACTFGPLWESAYAVRWVHSDRDRPVTVTQSVQAFASGCGVVVWLNGEQLYAKVPSAEPGRKVSVDASLRAGDNLLVVKSHHLTWQWQSSLKLEGKDGDDLADLRYHTIPPPAAAPGK